MSKDELPAGSTLRFKMWVRRTLCGAVGGHRLVESALRPDRRFCARCGAFDTEIGEVAS